MSDEKTSFYGWSAHVSEDGPMPDVITIFRTAELAQMSARGRDVGEVRVEITGKYRMGMPAGVEQPHVSSALLSSEAWRLPAKKPVPGVDI